MIAEVDSNLARALWNEDVAIASSWIAYAETSAAIARARRARRISEARSSAARRSLDRLWRAVHALDADSATATFAGRLATRHGLRGMAAIHLASALLVATARPLVVTWDAELRRAARAEGLAVVA